MKNRRRQTITVVCTVDTNLDAGTLERRIENFWDASRLADELLDGERVRFRDTTIEVNE